MEANPVLFTQLQKNRSSLCLNLCLDHSEGEVDFAMDDGFSGIVDGDIKTIEDTDKIQKLFG